MIDPSPLAAVRERIAAMREIAGVYRVSETGAQENVDADLIEWAANAVEEVLEAAPCDALLAVTHGMPCRQLRRVHGFGLGQVSGEYKPPAWLEAALTRATATTEGAR